MGGGELGSNEDRSSRESRCWRRQLSTRAAAAEARTAAPVRGRSASRALSWLQQPVGAPLSTRSDHRESQPAASACFTSAHQLQLQLCYLQKASLLSLF